MTTAYTSLLGLALPVTGELSGTWGDTVNNSITSLLDSAVAGTTTLSTDADVTLTTTTGASNTAREAILLWTAGGTVTRTITAPAQSKTYIVINKTSSTQSIKLVGAGPTTGVTIVAGESAVCAWNGLDFIKISNISGAGVFTSITDTGLISGRVTYATTGGLLTDSANLTFDGTTFTSGAPTVISMSSSSNALRITQTGAGNALLVEDSTNPDSTPFVIDASGIAVSGSTTAINYGGFTPNIQVNAAGSAQIGLSRFSANATSNAIAILKSRGTTVGDFTVLASGDTLGRLEFYGADGTTGIIGAQIAAAVDGTPGTNDMPGRLVFSTTADGASSPTERMRIDSSGNVLINTTSAVSGSKLVVASADATINGITVGRGGGAVSTNTALGVSALTTNSTGASNTALGCQSLQANTTASNNTAVGYQAGYSNTTGVGITALGYQALYSTTSSNSTAVGIYALKNSSSGTNSALGYSALSSANTGGANTGIGTNSLQANTSGNYNTALGDSSLFSNTTASNNTAVGYQAGYSNTTADTSVYVGGLAGYSVTTGGASTFVGYRAGYSVTGTYNTLIGYYSGNLITSGTKNTILGAYSGNQGGLDIRTASNYIVLSDGDGNPRLYGNNSGHFFINGPITDNAFLNIGADLSTSNCLALKDSGTTYGAGSTYQVFYNSANSIAGSIQHTATTTVNYNTSSDIRLKEDKGIATDTSVIDNLKIHNFVWKSDNLKDVGVFAQEAYEVKPSAVSVGTDELTEDGSLAVPWGVDYSKFVPDLVVYCQQLNKTVKELKALVDAQATEIAELKAR